MGRSEKEGEESNLAEGLPSPLAVGHQSEKLAEQLLRAVIFNIQFDIMLWPWASYLIKE